MKKLILSLLLLIHIGAFAQCASSSNIYSFTYNGKSYNVIKELKTWTQACSCAVQLGGHLVHIDDAAENAAMFNAVKTGAGVASNYTSVNDGGGAAYVWIGATDKKTEGNWLWDGDNDNTGTNFWIGQGSAGSGGGSAVSSAYVNWGGAGVGTYKEPDDYNSNQDAAGMALSNWPYGVPAEWNDINITNSIYYIVEFENTGTGENHSNQSNLIIYPNPSTQAINIDLSKEQLKEATVKIYSLEGRLVTEIEQAENIIDVSVLRPGYYFIEINSNESIRYARFVKTDE